MGATITWFRTRQKRSDDWETSPVACSYLPFSSNLWFFSKRLVSEAVKILVNTVLHHLLHLASHPYRDASDLPGPFPSPYFRSNLCTPLSNEREGKEIARRSKSWVDESMSLMTAGQWTMSGLNLTFFCLPPISWNKLAISYKAIDGIVELYELIISILNNLETKKALRSQKFKKSFKFWSTLTCASALCS